MTKKELISYIRDDVIEVAKKLHKEPTYPSETIARVLWLYQNKKVNDKTITSKNNPLGLKNPKTKEVMEFTSLQQCFIVADEQPFEEDDFEAKKENIIKFNNLASIDKLYIYSEKDIIIEVPEEKKAPKIDHYEVKDSKEKTILKTTSIEKAKEVAKKTPDAEIKNSKGATVNYKYKKSVNNATCKSLVAGSAIHCNDIYLYKNYNSKSPLLLLSNKTYYLFDGVNYGGRIAICVDPTKRDTRSDIYGFIDAKAIVVE